MITDASEAAIDQIVASCNGDIRGALKALLRVNEQLEAELAQLRGSRPRRWRAAATPYIRAFWANAFSDAKRLQKRSNGILASPCVCAGGSSTAGH